MKCMFLCRMKHILFDSWVVFCYTLLASGEIHSLPEMAARPEGGVQNEKV